MTTPSITIFIDRGGDFWFTLKISNRETFMDAIERLKNNVPAKWRMYDAENRMWCVAEIARPRLDDWVSHMQAAHDVEIAWRELDEANTEPEPKPRTAPDAFAVLHLLPTAPPEVVRASYLALAKKIHPDHGGSTAQMQRINEAYRQLAA